MIDFGSSSSIMPKFVAGQLGLKYEPMLKHVLQLDGTLVTIVGILNGQKMVLLACPSCTILQDMSIVELPCHFAICLSRGFTTQIGGYIAFDWSYMFF